MQKRRTFFWLSIFFFGFLNAQPRYYEYELPNLVASPHAFQTRDLFYFPEEFGFLSQSDFLYENTNKLIFDAGKTSSKFQRFIFRENLGFALSESFLLGVGFGFLSGSYKELNSPGMFSYSFSGAEDPSFWILYRALDQKDNPYFLDLKLLFSPSLGQGLDKNAYRGGHKIESSLLFGQAIWDFEYKFEFKASYYTLAKVQDGNFIVDQNSSYGLGASTSLQYDFNSRTSLDFLIDVSIPRKLQNKNSSEYEKSLFAVLFEAGPVYQFDEFISASLKLGYYREQGDKFYNSSLYKFTDSGYRIKANLNYAF